MKSVPQNEILTISISTSQVESPPYKGLKFGYVARCTLITCCSQQYWQCINYEQKVQLCLGQANHTTDIQRPESDSSRRQKVINFESHYSPTHAMKARIQYTNLVHVGYQRRQQLCIHNCRQTIADRNMVTINRLGLQEVVIALSRRTVQPQYMHYRQKTDR